VAAGFRPARGPSGMRRRQGRDEAAWTVDGAARMHRLVHVSVCHVTALAGVITLRPGLEVEQRRSDRCVWCGRYPSLRMSVRRGCADVRG
jgi:hypothetical protein